MMLSDVRDYIDTLGISENVYMGKLDAKKEKAVGVYNSRHNNTYKTALGGCALKSYGAKYVTFLVHWNKSLSETEKASNDLFCALRETREIVINGAKIKFIQLLTDGPVDVGTDDAGIFEMVIEAAVIFEKGKGE